MDVSIPRLVIREVLDPRAVLLRVLRQYVLDGVHEPRVRHRPVRQSVVEPEQDEGPGPGHGVDVAVKGVEDLAVLLRLEVERGSGRKGINVPERRPILSLAALEVGQDGGEPLQTVVDVGAVDREC